jgi:hypothetical protein
MPARTIHVYAAGLGIGRAAIERMALAFAEKECGC